MTLLICDLLQTFLLLKCCVSECFVINCGKVWLLYHISCLTPPVSCLTSLVSRLLFHVSCLMSPVSGLLSHVSCLMYPVSRLLSDLSCHMSPVSSLLSHVSCLMSPVSFTTVNWWRSWLGGVQVLGRLHNSTTDRSNNRILPGCRSSFCRFCTV